MSVTVQVDTGNAEAVCSVLVALLEDLSHARTIADVAIAAGVARQELFDLAGEPLDCGGQLDEAGLD